MNRKHTSYGSAKKILLVMMTIALVAGLQVGLSSGASDTISFVHDFHVKEAGDDCGVCHANVLVDKGIYKMLPAKATCEQCHDVKDEAKCTTCHSMPKAAKGWKKQVRKTNFLHSVHKDDVKDCAMCHGKDLDKKPVAAGDHKSCGGCHQEDIDNLLCAKCHRDMTFAGLNKLNRFTHKGDFMKQHGALATKSMRTCTQCHAESFCNDCHSKRADIRPSLKYPEAVKRNFIHRGDWLTMHRIEARADDSDCLKCHARKQCNECHQQRGASPASGRNFNKHPAGWLAKNSPNFHGEEARKNILACASCHDNGGPGDCVTCHKASTGNNPHPSGWEGNINGMKRSEGMCARCHDK